jgi:hypothetical protein
MPAMTPPSRLRAHLLGLVTAALLAWSPAARAQDASADDAGPDDDAFEHRIVAYDPQRSMGYGGCGVGGGARPSADASGCGALLALGLASGIRRRREP